MDFDWHTLWERVYTTLSADSAAAWVQAIGSILALVIAIWVSKAPINHAAMVKRKTIFAIVEAAYTHARNIRNAIEATDPQDWPTGNNYLIYKVYNKVVIEGVVKALQGIPMHELGSSKGVLALLSLTDQMVFLGSAIEALLQGPSRHPGMAKAMEGIRSDDYERRQALSITGFKVLKGNACGHLDVIDKDYKALRESLNQ